VRWYHLAADQGYAAAQSNLGAMYDRGEGVPQNYREALKWYRMSADQGNAMAQYNIGSNTPVVTVCCRTMSLHTCGSVCQQLRTTNAAKNRDVIAQRMTPAQIAEAQKLTREWKPKPRGHQLSDMH
jgi:uncharacterized protein